MTTAEISNPAPGATALKISAPPQSNTTEPPNHEILQYGSSPKAGLEIP